MWDLAYHFFLFCFFTQLDAWYALTSSRLLFPGKTLWSRSMHSSLWFGMSWEYWDKVNRKRWWSSAAQPHSLKRSQTQKTCDHIEGKMNKYNKVSLHGWSIDSIAARDRYHQIVHYRERVSKAAQDASLLHTYKLNSSNVNSNGARDHSKINIIVIKQHTSNAKQITSFCEIFSEKGSQFFLLQSKIKSHKFHTLDICIYGDPLVNSGRILVRPLSCYGLFIHWDKDF